MKINVSKNDAKAKALKELNSDASLYKGIDVEIKQLDFNKKEVREKILKTVMEFGDVDDKGHVVCNTDDFIVVNQKRVSTRLDEKKALDFLKARGLTKEGTVQIIAVSEDGIAHLVSSGKITQKELASFTEQKETTALVVKEKDDFK